MTERVNTWIDKFKNPAYIIMIIGVLYTISVTYSKVGDNVDELIEIKKELKDVHIEFDAHKIESIKERHKLELRIKELETEIETLKE